MHIEIEIVYERSFNWTQQETLVNKPPTGLHSPWLTHTAIPSRITNCLIDFDLCKISTRIYWWIYLYISREKLTLQRRPRSCRSMAAADFDEFIRRDKWRSDHGSTTQDTSKNTRCMRRLGWVQRHADTIISIQSAVAVFWQKETEITDLLCLVLP